VATLQHPLRGLKSKKLTGTPDEIVFLTGPNKPSSLFALALGSLLTGRRGRVSELRSLLRS